MKTQSILCLLVVSFLFAQCHSHEAETTTNVGTSAVKAISDKATEAKEASAAATKVIADKAKEAVQTNVAPTAESIKEKVKEVTPTLVSAKASAEEKVIAVKEKAVTAVKEVTKEADKPVVKKAATKPKKKKKKTRPVIKFEALSYGFGKIKQGEIVKHDFNFKNVGDAPLVIKKVDVSCGCTFPSYPFIPIEPGKEGTIGITYDSKNKAGRQKPVITVVTNGSPRTLKLNLEGYVE